MPPKSKKKRVEEEEADLSIEEQENRRKKKEESEEKERVEREKAEREKTLVIQRANHFFKLNNNLQTRADAVFKTFRSLLQDKTAEIKQDLLQSFVSLRDAFHREILNPESKYNETIFVLQATIASLQKKIVREGMVQSAINSLQKVEETLQLFEKKVEQFEREKIPLLRTIIQEQREILQLERQEEASKEQAQAQAQAQEQQPKKVSTMSALGVYAKSAGWIISNPPSFVLERFEKPKIYVHALNEPAQIFENRENPDILVVDGQTFYQPSDAFFNDICRETQMRHEQVITQLDRQFLVVYTNKQGKIIRHTPRINFLKNVNCLSEIRDERIKENFVKYLLVDDSILPEINAIQNEVHRVFGLPLEIVQKIFSIVKEALESRNQSTLLDFITFLSKNILTFLLVFQQDTNYKRKLVSEFDPSLLFLSIPEKMGSNERILFQYFENQADKIIIDLINVVVRNLFGFMIPFKNPGIPEEMKALILRALPQPPPPPQQPQASSVSSIWAQMAENAPMQPSLPQFDLFFFIDQAIHREESK